MAQKYIPRKPGTRPVKPQTDRAGRLKLNPPRKQFLDPEVEQLTDERARLAQHGVRPAMERPRPQVQPRAEGWTQQTDAQGRPVLQFKQPRVTQPAQHLADLSMAEREDKVKELGLPAFRARQLSTHYFSHYTTDPEQMTDLPGEKRAELVEAFFPQLLTEVRRIETEDRQTIKFLWKLFDGVLVESVLMRYQNRITLCVSSQAGCGMNCPFCATGQAGLTRNLSTAEIVDQIVAANKVIADGQLGKPEGAREIERVSNVVFMGMGEPLANYRRVINAVHRMVDQTPAGLVMTARNITVSTGRLVLAINKLAADSISGLYAPSSHAA